jgi:hypothetical protein
MEVKKEENIFVEPKFPLPKVQRGGQYYVRKTAITIIDKKNQALAIASKTPTRGIPGTIARSSVYVIQPLNYLCSTERKPMPRT